MWKYESCDFENVSLHDHLIERIQTSRNDILFIFDKGFDIAATHPLNDTGKSKRTATSQIVLRNAKFLKGVVHHWEFHEKRDTQEEVDLAWLIDSYCNFEVLDWVLDCKEKNCMVSLHGNVCRKDSSKSEYSEFVFSCNSVLFCWNDYSEDAWFEGWSEHTC